MARPFSELRSELSEDRQQGNREAAEQMMAELPLNELRKARQPKP